MQQLSAAGIVMFLLPGVMWLSEDGLVESHAERQVIAAEDARTTAKVAGDAPRFGQLLAPDFIKINRFGRLMGRREAIALARNPSYATMDVQLRLYHGSAVVTGRETDEGEPPGTVRFLRVWILDGGRWLELADQGTVISSQPAAWRAERTEAAPSDRTVIDRSGANANHIAGAAEATASLAREVRQAERAYRDAERLNEVSVLLQFRAPEFRLVDPLGNVLAPLTSVYPTIKAVVDEDSGVRVHGNLALVIGNVLRMAVNTATTDRFRYSSVWLRGNGEWHIVAEQRTPIM